MNQAALEEIIEWVVRSVATSEVLTPTPLAFLLRCYGLGDRDDIRAVLEPALARALAIEPRACTAIERASWLMVFADALIVSEDERLQAAAARLASALRGEWRRAPNLAGAATTIEACLRASRVVGAASPAAEAIDELERVVDAAYTPGAALGANDERDGRLANHVAMSSALLTAYAVSGRLPYPMLAEELMQFARRTMWDESLGCFTGAGAGPTDAFSLNCAAARVLCGLAALHHDAEYMAAAVTGIDAAYDDDAEAILASQARAARAGAVERSLYGLALLDWLQLRG